MPRTKALKNGWKKNLQIWGIIILVMIPFLPVLGWNGAAPLAVYAYMSRSSISDTIEQTERFNDAVCKALSDNVTEPKWKGLSAFDSRHFQSTYQFMRRDVIDLASPNCSSQIKVGAAWLSSDFELMFPDLFFGFKSMITISDVDGRPVARCSFQTSMNPFSDQADELEVWANGPCSKLEP